MCYSSVTECQTAHVLMISNYEAHDLSQESELIMKIQIKDSD